MRVSRLCLGMMSFGPHEDRPWTLDEEAAEPMDIFLLIYPVGTDQKNQRSVLPLVDRAHSVQN